MSTISLIIFAADLSVLAWLRTWTERHIGVALIVPLILALLGHF